MSVVISICTITYAHVEKANSNGGHYNNLEVCLYKVGSESFDEFYKNWKKKKEVNKEELNQNSVEDSAQKNIDDTFKDYRIQHLEDMYRINSAKIEELKNDINDKERYIVYVYIGFTILIILLSIYSIFITIKYRKIKMKQK